MNILVAGSRALEDWARRLIEEPDRKRIAFAAHLPLRITQELGQADCVLMEAQGSAAGQDAVGADESASGEGLPRLVVLDAGSEEPELGESDVFYLVRGSQEKLQLRQLAALIWNQRALRAMDQILSGPFAHDVRGSLSVLSLSSQLLDSGGDSAMVSPKLRKVERKLSFAVRLLKAHGACISGNWPPPAEHTGDRDDSVRLDEWLAAIHAERTISREEEVSAVLRRTSPWTATALAGAIDGCARLSNGDISVAGVATTKDTGGARCLTVTAQAPSVSDEQRQALSEPERWTVLSPRLVPYLLTASAAMVQRSGGAVKVEIKESELRLTLWLSTAD